MIELNVLIANFLRDAHYRIAELSVVIDKARRERRDHEEEFSLRAELILFMDLLLESRTAIYGGEYNYLADWTENEIRKECEYLRRMSGMNEIPYITFAGYSPQIRNLLLNAEDAPITGLPSGNPGDIILYDASGQPQTVPFPTIGGMTGETIDEYFS